MQVRTLPSTTLVCFSNCPQRGRLSYVWYKNGQKHEQAYYSVSRNSADSYSCAVKGHEDFPSASVCEYIPQFSTGIYSTVALPDADLHANSVDLRWVGSDILLQMEIFQHLDVLNTHLSSLLHLLLWQHEVENVILREVTQFYRFS